MDRCAACTGKYCQIPSSGSMRAKVAIYAERPGQWEERNAKGGYQQYGSRTCLIGPTGEEFNNNYLPLAGLDRDGCYVGNIVQCGADNNRKPTSDEISKCSANHVPYELESIQPEVVILMGASACSLLPDIDLEVEHGIPQKRKLFNWSGWIIPMYHPAAGLHDGAMMTPLLEDWERLRGWLENGVWMWPIDSIERDYGLIETLGDLEEFSSTYWRTEGIIGCDTESHDGVPWSIQISPQPGVARMALLNSRMATWLGYWLGGKIEYEGAELAFHHAPADIEIFEKVLGGMKFTYRDTMQEAYHFGNLRQGLKPLSRRLLGRKRLSWDETVTPPSKEALNQWLCDAFVLAESEWQITTPRYHKKSGKELKPDIARSDAEKLLAELMGYMRNNEGYDIWGKLHERMPTNEIDRLIARLGRPPVKGIAHCNLDDAVYYGCSDADDTLALALLFDRMRQEFKEGLNVQNEDIDIPRQRQSIQTHSYNYNHAL